MDSDEDEKPMTKRELKIQAEINFTENVALLKKLKKYYGSGFETVKATISDESKALLKEYNKTLPPSSSGGGDIVEQEPETSQIPIQEYFKEEEDNIAIILANDASEVMDGLVMFANDSKKLREANLEIVNSGNFQFQRLYYKAILDFIKFKEEEKDPEETNKYSKSYIKKLFPLPKDLDRPDLNWYIINTPYDIIYERLKEIKDKDKQIKFAKEIRRWKDEKELPRLSKLIVSLLGVRPKTEGEEMMEDTIAYKAKNKLKTFPEINSSYFELPPQIRPIKRGGYLYNKRNPQMRLLIVSSDYDNFMVLKSLTYDGEVFFNVNGDKRPLVTDLKRIEEREREQFNNTLNDEPFDLLKFKEVKKRKDDEGYYVMLNTNEWEKRRFLKWTTNITFLGGAGFDVRATKSNPSSFKKPLVEFEPLPEDLETKKFKIPELVGIGEKEDDINLFLASGGKIEKQEISDIGEDLQEQIRLELIEKNEKFKAKELVKREEERKIQEELRNSKVLKSTEEQLNKARVEALLFQKSVENARKFKDKMYDDWIRGLKKEKAKLEEIIRIDRENDEMFSSMDQLDLLAVNNQLDMDADEYFEKNKEDIIKKVERIERREREDKETIAMGGEDVNVLIQTEAEKEAIKKREAKEKKKKEAKEKFKSMRGKVFRL